MTDQISDKELGEIYEFAVQLGKDAGQVLMAGAQTRIGPSNGVSNEQKSVEKDSSVDIVTQTDEADPVWPANVLARRPIVDEADYVAVDVEAFIKNAVSERYPSHKFIGEETYSKGSSKEYLIKDEPTWCIDPLDGTVNFTHLFPMFCVSIALVVGGKPVIGVIYAPFLNQLFSACKGKGAYLNETQKLPLINDPIPPMPENAPKGCVFSCEWGKDRRDTPDGNLHRKIDSFMTMAMETSARDGKGGMVHGVRSLGSATLDLAYCAMGAFDIWWEGGCWEWDVAAGICLLEEAGGLVTTANPPEDPATAPIAEVKLGSRLYLAIRPAGPSSKESAREGQERVVREVWRRVRHLDYSRPGV